MRARKFSPQSSTETIELCARSTANKIRNCQNKNAKTFLWKDSCQIYQKPIYITRKSKRINRMNSLRISCELLRKLWKRWKMWWELWIRSSTTLRRVPWCANSLQPTWEMEKGQTIRTCSRTRKRMECSCLLPTWMITAQMEAKKLIHYAVKRASLKSQSNREAWHRWLKQRVTRLKNQFIHGCRRLIQCVIALTTCKACKVPSIPNLSNAQRRDKWSLQ